MDNTENDHHYVKAMLDDLDRILFYIEHVDFSLPSITSRRSMPSAFA
ncbi:MAG: hypothetical protein LKF89_04015 [Bacilli bacterium]|jgi:hypothetical protein|nr:hypothetical protein [Bacilli bacterium]